MVMCKFRLFLKILPIRARLCRRVRKIRQARGISRTRLARMAGICAMHYRLCEAGLKPFTVDEILRLKKALCCSFEQIAG